MTTKEKAKELIKKYEIEFLSFGDYLPTFKAKQCALIAVAELIYFSSNQTLSVDFDGDYYCDHDFFVEVKKEIEAL
jgi:hypothetical protein